jgi:hypothetical protein
MGAELFVVSCDQLPLGRDDIQAVVGAMRRRQSVVAAYDNPQAEFTRKTRRKSQFLGEGVPINMVPILDLAFRIARLRAFRKVRDRRASLPGLSHQPSDFSPVLSDVY